MQANTLAFALVLRATFVTVHVVYVLQICFGVPFKYKQTINPSNES